MPASNVLAVFAHPDDESLSAGGLLARTSAAGGRATVITATWSEDSRRAPELREALRLLGAEGPHMLGYADSRVPESAPGALRLCDAPLDEAVHLLVQHIRRLQPSIIVTHDAYGGVTAHPDHLHTYRITALAAESAALDGAYPNAGPPWRADSLYLATHPHSVTDALAEIIGMRKVRHSVPDAQVSVTLDATPWLDRKIAAILAHRSEVDRGALPGLVQELDENARATLLSTEWYTRRPIPGL